MPRQIPLTNQADTFSSLFAPESPKAGHAGLATPWKVLLVDDEDDIHAVLHMALRDMEVEGFPLQLLDARSAQEARSMLQAHPDISLILLDVVMESELAGLSLVTYIRKELCNHLVQIVLITGQPGRASQEQVHANYEINGYRLKSELSVFNIYTSVNLALRAYKTLRDFRDAPQVPELPEIEATELALENAIDAHRQWRDSLYEAVAQGRALDPSTLRRDDCCALGRWLHASGQRLYGGKPEFAKLVDRHDDFHLSASMVVDRINDGETTDAAKLLGGHSQFAQASIDVEVAIMKLMFSLSS